MTGPDHLKRDAAGPGRSILPLPIGEGSLPQEERPLLARQGLFIVTLSGNEGSKVLSVPTILVPKDFRFFASGSE